MQLSSALLAVALLAQHAAAQPMLRFGCAQLTNDRIDPLVNPNQTYTGHLHQIIGGNSFQPNMNWPGHDPVAKSTCTSCQFNQDFSNYWTPNMFFRHKNGSYIRVPKVGNGGPQGKLNHKDGFDIYYIKPTSGTVKAFAPGFRMLAGDAANNDTSKVTLASICHRCWTSTSDTPFVGGAPCSGSDTVEIPSSTSCKMIRQTIIFPTCWDGVNLDSADHKSHVKYSSSLFASGGGNCPSSHPTKLPQIMYELMWDVSKFANDQASWPADGKPYIYAMGIGGAGAHADYVFGWKDNVLQKAMDNNCQGNTACSAAGLTVQSQSAYDACTLPQSSPEQIDGYLPALPGRGSGGSTVVGPTTTATTTRPTTPTPTSTTGGATVPKYGQCGGQGYTGPTQCAAGSTCTFSNTWYSQCL